MDHVVDDPLAHVHADLFAEGDQTHRQQSSGLMVVSVIITVLLFDRLRHDRRKAQVPEMVFCL